MTTLTKRKDSPAWNLGRSLLKSTAVNFGLQAIGGNLRKDNIWQTLLVGVAGGFGDYLGGNTAMGAILGGGNAIINKSNFVGTTAKYALCGAAADVVLRVAEAKAAEPEQKQDKKPSIIDPFGYLNRKGLNYLHAHASDIKEATFDEAGSMVTTFTADHLITSSLQKAFLLARMTQEFQSVDKLFADHANALFFVEYDAINGRGVYGKADISLRKANEVVGYSPRNRTYCINHHNLYYWAVTISIYVEEYSSLPIKQQIARMAVTIGHELFIHKKIETVELWKATNYGEALDMAFDRIGGDNDHKQYIQSKNKKTKQRMDLYLEQLQSAASKANVGVSAYDIRTAISEHDKEYLHLKNR